MLKSCLSEILPVTVITN